MAHLCVLGSLNIDYFTKVKHFAAPGETVLAEDFVRRFGGKGANQAVSAARQGVEVRMIGCVGNDEMGVAYRARLETEGIDISRIQTTSSQTGAAFISIDSTGENTIVVAPGANGLLGASEVDAAKEDIESAGALLLQFETTVAAVRRAVEIATDAEVPVILNPSPFRAGFPWSELPIDYLIVNEGEAAQIDERLANSEALLVKNLIITRGAKSVLVYGMEEELEVPVIEVDPVDTVGAGDAFAGAFAAYCLAGDDLETAVGYAQVAGALTTLKIGAQEAIPTREEVETRMRLS